MLCRVMKMKAAKIKIGILSSSLYAKFSYPAEPSAVGSTTTSHPLPAKITYYKNTWPPDTSTMNIPTE